MENNNQYIKKKLPLYNAAFEKLKSDLLTGYYDGFVVVEEYIMHKSFVSTWKRYKYTYDTDPNDPAYSAIDFDGTPDHVYEKDGTKVSSNTYTEIYGSIRFITNPILLELFEDLLPVWNKAPIAKREDAIKEAYRLKIGKDKTKENNSKLEINEPIAADNKIYFYHKGATWGLGLSSIKIQDVPDTFGMHYINYYFNNPGLLHQNNEIELLVKNDVNIKTTKKENVLKNGLSCDDSTKEDNKDLAQKCLKDLIKLEKDLNKAIENNENNIPELEFEYKEAKRYFYNEFGKFVNKGSKEEINRKKRIKKNFDHAKENIIKHAPDMNLMHEHLEYIKIWQRMSGYIPPANTKVIELINKLDL